MWYREFYRPSRPHKVVGGIKAQSKRGQFGTSWWAKRWIAVLESLNLGGRLDRGKSYARNGQVLSIEVRKGQAVGSVQGSRPDPYVVSIEGKELSAAEWTKVIDALKGQASYLAKLLAGEMPEDIEKVFTAAGVSLFPNKASDLRTACSCPDFSNPCKHVAAVYYLLGEEFDRDPFLIFQLRGMSREQLMKRLQGSSKAKRAEAPAAKPEPLPGDSKAFWSGGQLPADVVGDVQPPPIAAALPKRLGKFPFWRGQEHFLESLEPIYRQAGERGLRTLATEPDAE